MAPGGCLQHGWRALRPVTAAVALLTTVGTVAAAAPVTVSYTYRSSVSTDANGPLDLTAELNYNPAVSNAPIAVVMHGFSDLNGNFDRVRLNAKHLRDKGFFAISVAMRRRDWSDGMRDSGGVEVHDIYDAVESVLRSHATNVNAGIVYITGYSGGGGSVMSALTKFPDYFNAGTSLFGMSDYGYDPVTSWYFNGADFSHRQILRDSVGDPDAGSVAVTDRYHARASALASANNPYTEIHLFADETETLCPRVNNTAYYQNAVNQARYEGEFDNIHVHVGQSGQYVDFNQDGLQQPNEEQSWPHGWPTIDQQNAAEAWFMNRLLAGRISRPQLRLTGRLVVPGFVRTRPFSCWAGDGQAGMAQLDYNVTGAIWSFDLQVLSLNRELPLRLTVSNMARRGQRMDVVRNGQWLASFRVSGEHAVGGLQHGDHVDFIPTPQEPLRITSARVTGAALEVQATSAVPGEICQLEYTTNLATHAWTPVGGRVMATSTTVTLRDPEHTGNLRRWYRVASVP